MKYYEMDSNGRDQVTLGRTLHDNRWKPKGMTRDDPPPEAPTNNDIAVRNLQGSTTALHLDQSFTVPDEEMFFFQWTRVYIRYIEVHRRYIKLQSSLQL